jgi:hypothetical protein
MCEKCEQWEAEARAEETGASQSVAGQYARQGITDKVLASIPLGDEDLMRLAVDSLVSNPEGDGITMCAIPTIIVHKITEEVLKFRLLHQTDPEKFPFDQDEGKEVKEQQHPGYL